MGSWRLASGTEDSFTALADALDAGLPAESALAAAGLATRVGDGAPCHEQLAAACPDLTPTERAVLRAAEGGGSLAAALRQLAGDRQTRRERRRELAGRLAYPALVVASAALVSVLFASIGMPGLGAGFWVGSVTGLGACAALVTYARRRLAVDPTFEPPLLGVVAARAAATPYFEALLALYAAGVRVDEAHREAVAACPNAPLRARLVATSTSLAAGTSLTESLERAGACDEWARRVLGEAERTGTLEAGLRHVLVRLRAANDATARRAVRALGALAYAFAILVVLLTVGRFYGGLTDRLGGIGR